MIDSDTTLHEAQVGSMVEGDKGVHSMKKDSVFDVMLGELAKLAGQKYSMVFPQRSVDVLALAKVRFIEEILEKSELAQTELERARLALQNAYIAVEPGYTVGKVHLHNIDLDAFRVAVPKRGGFIPRESKKKLRAAKGLEDFGSELSAETKALLDKKPRLPKNLNIIVGETPADEQLKNVVQGFQDRRAKRQEVKTQNA